MYLGTLQNNDVFLNFYGTPWLLLITFSGQFAFSTRVLKLLNLAIHRIKSTYILYVSLCAKFRKERSTRF